MSVDRNVRDSGDIEDRLVIAHHCSESEHYREEADRLLRMLMRQESHYERRLFSLEEELFVLKKGMRALLEPSDGAALPL